MGKRPRLTKELESLGPREDPKMVQSGPEVVGTEEDSGNLRFLVDLYRQCTEEIPSDRPTAENLYSILLARTSSSLSGSKIIEQVSHR